MRFIIMSLLSFLLLNSGAWCAGGPAEKPVVLLTEEEAAMGEEKVFGFSSSLPKDGPIIKVLQPKVDSDLHTPFKLHVRFIPKEGSEVNLASLKVEALKIVNVNITPRLLPYAAKDGIKMDNVTIPSGRHRIRVTILDTLGRETQEIFAIHVI